MLIEKKEISKYQKDEVDECNDYYSKKKTYQPGNHRKSAIHKSCPNRKGSEATFTKIILFLDDKADVRRQRRWRPTGNRRPPDPDTRAEGPGGELHQQLRPDDNQRQTTEVPEATIPAENVIRVNRI